MQEEFIPPEKREVAVMREIYDWVESGLTAVICVVLIFTFVMRMVGVSGDSMFPTLEDNDRLIATRLYDRPHQGDIVVVTQPNSRNEPLIKRVVATGGQTLDIDLEDGTVIVDGIRLYEPYIAEPIYPETVNPEDYPMVVPEGHVFVMGDNRNNSWDSRSHEIGMVDERYILGKVIFRLLPYESFGKPDRG